MTRIGKIARLPRDLRHELNHRLADGAPGVRLVAWLNRQPVVQTILAAEFQGRPISPQNLSEWNTGGYQDWLVQQETVALTRELADNATEVAEAAGGQLADHLAVLLAQRYARLLAQWDGEPDAAFQRKAQALRALGRDVAALRRGDQAMERLRLEQEKYAVTLKARGLLALEAVLEEVKRLPDVADAFDKAFALFREHQPETPLIPEAATPVRPNPREAGWDAYSGTEAPEPETGVPTTNVEPFPESETENLRTPHSALRTDPVQANQTESNPSAAEAEGDAELPPAPPTPEATSPEAEPPAHQETGEIRPDPTESNHSEGRS